MKYLILLILIVGCDSENLDIEELAEEQEPQVKILEVESCITGCSFYYDILRGSVSSKNPILNIDQIEGLNNQCKLECKVSNKGNTLNKQEFKSKEKPTKESGDVLTFEEMED